MHERIIDNAVSICYLGIVCPSLQYFIVRFTVSTIDMYGYIDIMSAQVDSVIYYCAVYFDHNESNL